MIDLHYWPTPNGLKVSVMLEEIGAAYRVIPVDIGNGDQFEASFLKVSPNNKIPGLVDSDPPESYGSGSLSLFESGCILVYLAEKSGRFLPTPPRPRAETLQWLFWQMGGLGPMLGQNHHFTSYAPERIPYAFNRYLKETERLYQVMENRLTDREYLAGDYSVADIACYPWIRPHKKQGMDLNQFPALKKWFDAVSAREAVVRAYDQAKQIHRENTFNEKEKKVLFGQSAQCQKQT